MPYDPAAIESAALWYAQAVSYNLVAWIIFKYFLSVRLDLPVTAKPY